MSNEVAKTSVFGGNVAMPNAAALSKALDESANKDPRGGTGEGDYLNFSGKKGIYTIGVDKRVIPSNELWVINISSFQDGWVCWKGGKPEAKRFANIMDTPVPTPNMEELGPFNTAKGDGWFQAKAMVLKSLDHDQQGAFSINSVSGVSAVAELQKMVAGRHMQGEPAWPIVSLGSEEFTAQGFTNSKPVFDVYGWVGPDELETLMQDEDADIDELIELAASGGEPAPVDEKPKGRGRGRKL